MARLRPRTVTAPAADVSANPGRDHGAVVGAGAGAAEAVLVGYRLIRRLATGDRADVYLAAARHGAATDDPASVPSGQGEPLVVMRVYGENSDDAAIATEIEAMQHDGTGPTPALLDVASLDDGRVCLVVERIGGLPLRALLAAGDLLPGQAVTALAPIVVAVRDLADRGLVHPRLAATDVLVDEGGRPRLLGLGALARLDGATSAGERVDLLRSGHAALLRLVEEVAASSRDPRALEPVSRVLAAAVEARPFVRAETEVERALFATADASPLPGVRAAEVRVPGVPSRLAPIGSDGTQERVDGRLVGDDPEAIPARHGRWGRLAEMAQLPGGFAEELAGSLDRDPRAALIRRLTGWVQRRRPVLLTGGLAGAAALVVLLTAVPPSAAGTRPESDASIATPAAVSSPEPGPAPTPTAMEPTPATGTTGDDPVTAAAALLEIRATCLASADADCLAAIEQPGSPIEARDRAALEQGAEVDSAEFDLDLDAISLVADLGDAVVVSVPARAGEREPASLLMMRSEAGWRLREWFD